MSVSNNTFRDFSFDVSDEARREEADFYISNVIESLWNSSEPHIITPDDTGSETNIYGYNSDSRKEKNEEKDYGNQMIEHPELLVNQDMDANALRVEHEPLSENIGNNEESHANSYETRVEEADFHNSNQIESLWDTLDPYDSTATTDSETNAYGYNRDIRGEKNEEKDYRKEMIDFPELLVNQDMDANALRVEHVPLSENIGNNVESHADSDKTRREEADFYISNLIESLRNSSEPHIITPDDTVTTGSETNVYEYNPDSRKEKNEEKDYRNQMIELPELLVNQDMDANALRVEHVPLSENIGNNVESPANSYETRVEEADFHISNQIESLWNTLDPYDSTATTDSETNVYGYNRDIRGEKNEEKDYRNQMIDFPELLVDQDMGTNTPRVEHVPLNEYRGNSVESHADSVATGNTCDIAEDAAKINKLTTYNKLKRDLIKRYCSKCKIIVVGAVFSRKVLCAKCETPLCYQCARCDKPYSNYVSLWFHLNRKCNTQNLDLKCPLCNYQTRSTISMSKHQVRCLSGVNFSCGFCVYTSKFKDNLLRHMIIVHKDILKIDCSQCKTKKNKCKQCRNMVAFCEFCHIGLGSTDGFQEHQKSCKQPVLECKYCPYKTNTNNKLKRHVRLKHLSALTSQALPTKD